MAAANDLQLENMIWSELAIKGHNRGRPRRGLHGDVVERVVRGFHQTRPVLGSLTLHAHQTNFSQTTEYNERIITAYKLP